MHFKDVFAIGVAASLTTACVDQGAEQDKLHAREAVLVDVAPITRTGYVRLGFNVLAKDGRGDFGDCQGVYKTTSGLDIDSAQYSAKLEKHFLAVEQLESLQSSKQELSFDDRNLSVKVNGQLVKMSCDL